MWTAEAHARIDAIMAALETGETTVSYDIWLEADLGGPEPVTVGDLDWNHFGGGSPVWCRAGADLSLMDRQRAGDWISRLTSAATQICENPEQFTAAALGLDYDPHADLVAAALGELIVAFKKAPDATIRVWR